MTRPRPSGAAPTGWARDLGLTPQANDTRLPMGAPGRYVARVFWSYALDRIFDLRGGVGHSERSPSWEMGERRNNRGIGWSLRRSGVCATPSRRRSQESALRNTGAPSAPEERRLPNTAALSAPEERGIVARGFNPWTRSKQHASPGRGDVGPHVLRSRAVS